MYVYLSVLPSSKHKIIVFLKHRCVVFISIKLLTMSKSNPKIRKTRNYPCAWKSYSTSRTGIAGHKKKELIIKTVKVNSKTATLSYFDKWEKKQQDQGGKYFFFIHKSTLIERSFYHLQFKWDYLVKNILLQVRSVLKMLSFWNKFWIIIYFLLLQKNN